MLPSIILGILQCLHIDHPPALAAPEGRAERAVPHYATDNELLRREPELSTQLLVALASSIVGGSLVALIGQLATRKRTEAEVRKLDAEADRTRAETSKLLSEIRVTPAEPAPGGKAPLGWFLAGSEPGDYDVGTETGVAHSGTRSAFIASQPNPRGFGTLMQEFKADTFVGSRLRLSAYIKTADVVGQAALWMRVDASNGDTLAFDNMRDRCISGTTEWRRYDIVLDVSDDAELITFGILLAGAGKAWLDDVQFEPVSNDVPTTAVKYAPPPLNPANLDFEQIA